MLRPLLVSFGTLTLITGLAYPALVTGLAQAVFPANANGSLLVVEGAVRGSRRIAQATVDPQWFWSRPSATGAFPTHAGASGGSCVAPSNPRLAQSVAERVAALRASDPENHDPIPQDLVTASASGLDPHLSREAAAWQATRIAKARGIPREHVMALIARKSFRTINGASVVSVLELNAELATGSWR